MIFQEILLLRHGHFRKGLQLPEMRPAILIYALQLIITALTKKGADGNMHKVLLLLFREFIPQVSKLLDANEEKNSFHIGLFPEPFHEPGFQVPPSRLQIILRLLHGAKVRKRRETGAGWAPG